MSGNGCRWLAASPARPKEGQGLASLPAPARGLFSSASYRAPGLDAGRFSADGARGGWRRRFFRLPIVAGRGGTRNAPGSIARSREYTVTTEQPPTTPAKGASDELRAHGRSSPHFALFDSMCWPRPTERVGDIERKMRHEPDALTTGDLMLAASVLNAYREIMTCSAGKRAAVVAGIRKSESAPRSPRVPS